MIRLAKRPKAKSGILRAPPREFPRHRRFVRSHVCCVPGCQRPAVCAHLRTAANSGTGLKPGDWETVPLCNEHHAEQEGRTETFGRKYGIDLWAIAADLAKQSPDTKMKAVMAALCLALLCLATPAHAELPRNQSYLWLTEVCVPSNPVNGFRWCREFHRLYPNALQPYAHLDVEESRW